VGFTGFDFAGHHQAKAHKSSESDIIVCIVNISHYVSRFQVVFKSKDAV
jgi:hypothetical protein